MGIFSGIADIFGAIQQKRSAGEAVRILQEARSTATTQAKSLFAQSDPFIGQAGAAVAEAEGYTPLLAQILNETQGLDTSAGLTEADKIAYGDAAKLLNEQMVGTGNLRSGAAAFGQSELLRRVVADASTRQFGRQVSKLQLLFGGQAQGVNTALARAGTAGQIGLAGQSLGTQLLNAAISGAGTQGQFELGKGMGGAAALGAGGGVLDTIVNTGAGYAMGGVGGAAMGGQDYAKLNLLTQLFQKK